MENPKAVAALGFSPPSSSVSLLLILPIFLCYACHQQIFAPVAARCSPPPEIVNCLPRSGHIGARYAPAQTWPDPCRRWIRPGKVNPPWRCPVREPKLPEFPDLASWPCATPTDWLRSYPENKDPGDLRFTNPLRTPRRFTGEDRLEVAAQIGSLIGNLGFYGQRCNLALALLGKTLPDPWCFLVPVVWM